jgi:hypothetical protein
LAKRGGQSTVRYILALPSEASRVTGEIGRFESLRKTRELSFPFVRSSRETPPADW